MDDDATGIGARLRRVPLTWWLPVPAVVAHALVLLGSRRVWTTLVETSSRSGRSGSSIAAHGYLMLLAVALGGYAIIGATGDGAWGAGGRGMSPPTPEESAVVRVLLRGLCLVALYASAISIVRAYVFG
ncbi:MAG: hypothetical protein JWM10_5430 [Myxococcaceae bacterium]|nr:hypothetical protein [Myxococcaceae bacterium]